MRQSLHCVQSLPLGITNQIPLWKAKRKVDKPRGRNILCFKEYWFSRRCMYIGEYKEALNERFKGLFITSEEGC